MLVLCIYFVLIILFHLDPPMHIHFERDLSTYEDEKHTHIVINVTCEAQFTQGKPHISLSYTGSKIVEVDKLDEETHIQQHGDFFHGTHRELLRLPTTGHISCHIIDRHGAYKVLENIVADVPGKIWSCPKICFNFHPSWKRFNVRLGGAGFTKKIQKVTWQSRCTKFPAVVRCFTWRNPCW